MHEWGKDAGIHVKHEMGGEDGDRNDVHEVGTWQLAHCNTLQHAATYCNILQHTATQRDFNDVHEVGGNNLTATHCNTLQHAAEYT